MTQPPGGAEDRLIHTSAIHHSVDVGYYAPAARTTLNVVCSCVLAPELDRPNSLPLPRVLPLREEAGAFRHPAVGTPKSPRQTLIHKEFNAIQEEFRCFDKESIKVVL